MMMQSVQDAIYNWLTIKVVSAARPDDTAAVDTLLLFEDLLEENHKVHIVDYSKDDEMYLVTYNQNESEKSMRFPVELIDILLDQINAEPEKYRNYDLEE